MRLPRAMIALEQVPITIEANRIERPECEPPPTGTMSVSPCTSFTCSNGTASHSLTHCAKLVSCPCPLDSVPIATSTSPSGLTVIFDHSRG